MHIKQRIEEAITVKKALLQDTNLHVALQETIDCCIETFKTGGRLLLCGNGGSASDAQHIAAELSGRFYLDRPPLDAEALHVNSSYLTAVANDYSYDEIYARLTKAKGRSGDTLIGISTSGNSENIVRAFRVGKEKNMTCIAFTGELGGKLAELADILVNVPSNSTPRIQEMHILLGHILCEEVEAAIFG